MIWSFLFIFIVHTLFTIVENVNTRRKDNMILEGPVLIYGRVSLNNFVLNDSTIMNYPEKMPVVWNYEFGNPELVLGYAEISKVDSGLWATVTITNERFKSVMLNQGKVYCGGYYRCNKSHTLSDGVRCVDKANLLALGIYLAGDDWLYLNVKEED